jgi:Cu(I)/Ag(I) efflux system membrane protein CusA/SilA
VIAGLIRWSIANRPLVLIATAMLVAAGLWSASRIALDALPDLSDVQVIVRTPYPGKAPQVVEDLVTYPLTTTMLSVPGAKTVRGYSFFGDSFVYILFDDRPTRTGRARASSNTSTRCRAACRRAPMPRSVRTRPASAGSTSTRWSTAAGRHDLGELRALQDWFLKFELKTVPDVAEVASIGGMVRQYQVVLDPGRMRGRGITQASVVEALQKANQAAGGSVVELGEAEYMVRSRGYLRSLEDFRSIPLGLTGATPVLLGDVAHLQIGPEMRRGVAELDGEGEVAGGIIVMRAGKNALTTIDAVKAKLRSLEPSLPAGVEVVPTYDRSLLIDRAVTNLTAKLIAEFIVVALVCALFLFHLRSALVAVVALPVGPAGGVHRHARAGGQRQHHVARRPSDRHRGDGRRLDRDGRERPQAPRAFESSHGRPPSLDERWRLVADAGVEVGPALFFRCSSSRFHSSRCSRSRPRRGDSSPRWHSPKPTPWRPRQAFR